MVERGAQGLAFMEAQLTQAAHDAHDGAFDVEHDDDAHGGDQIQREMYRASFKEAQTQMMR